MPTLVHDGFALYETGAISRYIDRAFAGPSLQPGTPRALARMDQIIGVVDSYGYWPLVRQVFSQRVFRPAVGQPADEAEVARGLAGAAKVLAALEDLASSDTFLVGAAPSLADLHLGAMIAYFTAAPEGRRHARPTSATRRLVEPPAGASIHGGDGARSAGHSGVSEFALRPAR